MLATTSMEVYSANNNSWIPQELLEMEENHSVHHQYCQVDSLDDDSSKEIEFHPLSSESYFTLQNSCPKTTTGFNNEAPSLALHRNNKAKPSKNKSKVSSNIICFGSDLDSAPVSSQKLNRIADRVAKNPHQFDGAMIYPPFMSSKNKINSPKAGNNEIKKARELPMARDSALFQQHALAERKRRENLSQHFIALSALIPGLKKGCTLIATRIQADKASILGDGVKYLKQLQERVTKLEEQTSTKRMESTAYLKKSRFYLGDENSSKENSDSHCFDQLLPEIETRICEKDVLIRAHCVNVKGIMQNIICEIEKLQLSVLSSSALPFGDHVIAITIVAKMDVGNSMKVKDLARNLRQAFLSFM